MVVEEGMLTVGLDGSTTLVRWMVTSPQLLLLSSETIQVYIPVSFQVMVVKVICLARR